MTGENITPGINALFLAYFFALNGHVGEAVYNSLALTEKIHLQYVLRHIVTTGHADAHSPLYRS